MHSSSTAWFHRWTASLMFFSVNIKVFEYFSMMHSFRTVSSLSSSSLLDCSSTRIFWWQWYMILMAEIKCWQKMACLLNFLSSSLLSWPASAASKAERSSFTILKTWYNFHKDSALFISNQADIELTEVWYLEGGKGVVSWGVVPNPPAPLSTSSGNLGCECLVWVKFQGISYTDWGENTDASSPKVPTTEVAWDWWHHCLKDN